MYVWVWVSSLSGPLAENSPAASGDFADPVVRAAIKKARTLLSGPRALSRLDDVWGHNGGIRYSPIAVVAKNI